MTDFHPSACAARKRHVFFVSGFDPRGASHYHALFQTEAAKQDTVSGTTTTVGQRTRDAQGNSYWSVASVPKASNSGGTRTDTVYEFTRWDDIVRNHWPRSVWRLLADLVFGYSLIVRSGGIATTWRLSRKTLIFLSFPLVVLGGCLVVALALSVWAAAAAAGFGAAAPVAVAAGASVLVLGLWATHRLEMRLNSTSLVRIFSFCGRLACGQVPELDARIAALARKINDTLHHSDVDEVLVVGFSLGSIVSVSGVARALQALPTDASRTRPYPALSLMTLGHCIPMLGLLPQATRFRDELKTLAAAANLRWIDFSSLTDWGSFAMVDPVDACRITLPKGQKHNPTMRSPRFHTQFAAEVYDKLKRDKLRIHMQYLMSAELPSEYDYFAITAGDLTLDERYRRSPTSSC